MSRNLNNVQVVLATLVMLGCLQGRVVDYAGGFGILVRLLRDCGIDALWADRYCQNLVARGFEYNAGKAVLITAFEAFEHFVYPSDEVNRILTISPNVLFSTELIAGTTPSPDDWWYYGREHGQHIGFFRLKTLEFIAAKNGKYLISDGHSYHLMSDRPVNSIIWRALLKAKRFLPMILKSKSKTWQDHITISGRDR
jgi:hypothetical protein